MWSWWHSAILARATYSLCTPERLDLCTQHPVHIACRCVWYENSKRFLYRFWAAGTAYPGSQLRRKSAVCGWRITSLLGGVRQPCGGERGEQSFCGVGLVRCVSVCPPNPPPIFHDPDGCVGWYADLFLLVPLRCTVDPERVHQGKAGCKCDTPTSNNKRHRGYNSSPDAPLPWVENSLKLPVFRIYSFPYTNIIFVSLFVHMYPSKRFQVMQISLARALRPV